MVEKEDEPIGFESEELKITELLVPSTLQDKYHAILRKSSRNGCGKFQIIASTIVMFCLIGFGYIEYGLGYLELMPQFVCSIDGVD